EVEDVLPVLARDAEHLGDHRERDDGGERLDEVDLGAIGHERERLVDDPAHRRPLELERLRRELLAQEIAVPAVLGRVHVEQMAEWRGVGGRLLLGKDPEPRGDDEPPVVAQDGAAVLVPGDRPERQHPRGLEPGDGRMASEPRPGGVRVAVAAVVERVDDLPADDGTHARGIARRPLVAQQRGTPEVLIYNGGRRPFGVLVETTPEVFEETWRVHAFGAFLWARQVVPAMLERHQGAILITGATAGVKPGPNSAAFGPAKFAVR